MTHAPETQRGVVCSSAFSRWKTTLPPLLDAAGLGVAVAGHPLLLLKPNLVEALAPPVTTPVRLTASLIDYLREHAPKSRIVIGEGTGSLDYDTFYAFEKLGYRELAQEKGVELLDLNTEELRRRKNGACRRWPEMFLPVILEDAFLISLPVLKAHTLAGVTLTMKNMMGCAPPLHYYGGGSWGKSSFHDRMHEAIFDLNRYRTPDFTLLDATVGMARAHLWGPTCDPPVNRLAASWDPVAVDSYGAALLGRDWRDIDHIRLAHRCLGQAAPLQHYEIEGACNPAL